MSFRRFATTAALAIAGVAAAVGIGLLANGISGSSVGVGAEPLSAGETLAPADARAEERARERQRQRQRRNRNRNRGGDDIRTTTSPTVTDEIAPPTTTDDGSSGSGSDDSSGHGGGDSGSNSGSGSSGSDDSGGDD